MVNANRALGSPTHGKLLSQRRVLMMDVGRIYRAPNALKLCVLASVLALERLFPLLVAQCAGSQEWEPRRRFDRSLCFIGAVITAWLAIVALGRGFGLFHYLF
jgi:hypothetical protein